MTEPTTAEAVELLRAVLEALDIPFPATTSGEVAYHRVLADRAGHARRALSSALDGPAPLGWAWEAAYLRERVAEHPPTGYVTTDQADAALAEGKTWTEAVRLHTSLADDQADDDAQDGAW
ncbi:hypothetical protein [Streptomyces sp. NPDC049881]|uniref:hypothetical protein n=1 Tax=Streptomyces sp. NPDC049881 TaxID=3155778 RepID=UPI003417BF7F